MACKRPKVSGRFAYAADREISAMYSLAADAILVVHFAFVVFVVGGQIFVIVGYFQNWRWIRNLTFRICHILAIGFVVAQAWASQLCPLTIWESNLRYKAAEEAYQGSFIEHWVGRMIYYDAPQWIFILVYSLFGALVLISWVWARPERKAARKS